MSKEELINKLPIGKENAIHQAALASILGVSSEKVKLMVRFARQSGAEILSGKQGYWIAKDDAERRAFISSFCRHASSRFKTTRLMFSAQNT